MIIHLESVSSTMDAARDLLPQKPEDGTAIYADYQEQGRGRVQGRRWVCPKGESLLVTFLFKTESVAFPISSFPLYAGYVTARCLKRLYGIECQVKWPNDVLVEGAKISGIYTECIDNYISCGIGINLLQKQFDPSYRRKACSVKMVSGRVADREELLKEMIKEFMLNLKNSDWIKDFQSILYKNNENITVLDGLADSGTIVTGILSGIGGYGQMLIKLPDGTVKEIFTGEIR
ncbi:MAG: biotin--[acetyl-CoA-carboxylase] ligase [Spirochaetia bacterium]|nr:biotin--[acetyl-CoA-carboxylase] ligase [Spirochaetia bacterium]